MNMIKKYLDLIIVAFFVLSLVMYDLTLQVLGELLHMMFEVLHNLFEWVELGTEEVVEYIFHVLDIGDIVEYLFATDRHGSQVVTFYILLTIAGYGFYRLWKTLPRLYEVIKQFVLEAWVRRKTQLQLYWLTLPLVHKVALVATAIGVAYLASFFVM
ncbi:MAG: hypothetical protein LUQ11_15640 [Methylococcaceae bacterium]|nr:hypothetical protein [Methylococcaceae bacterium]